MGRLVLNQMHRSPFPPRDSGEESSSSSSPERTVDEDNDFFMFDTNDSESSIGVANFRDLRVDTDKDAILPPIYRLPPELLIAIFSKLSSPIDLLNCIKVSQIWAINCVGLLWLRPLCSTWEKLETIAKSIAQPDGYFPYHGLVKRLNLTALNAAVNDGTVASFIKCKRIERLTLTKCSNLTDEGVSGLVEGNRQLQALDVTELKSLTDRTLVVIANNCPRLQGLNVTGCAKLSDESLATLADSCRHLKRLKLNSVSQVTDRAIQAFAKNCPSMLEIDLSGCHHISNVSVVALLSTLRNLRELRLAQCVKISDRGFLSLSDNLVFESLRILDLTACENVTDDSVEKIIRLTPRLRNLLLSKCRFITDRSVHAICKLGKNINYVHLGHCSNITDAAVIQLVKSCTRIRFIDLACCNRLTDNSVQHLATLPKLRRIGLVKCHAISDRGILALAKPRPLQHPSISSLERVHLSYCLNLSLEGIHTLLNHCPRLTHLSLTGVPAFLRSDVTAFCRPAPDEFTAQQRNVFCVFSGDGVRRLRDFLNNSSLPGNDPGTMYDDGEELDDDTQVMDVGIVNIGPIDGDGDDISGLDDGIQP
ncbi:SCF ubiquitin ligase complex subunit [Myotisia sp. PD_48]|nr:SCF ubiquitin ligase complex subunit [Myotisia sp. PD_48]